MKNNSYRFESNMDLEKNEEMNNFVEWLYNDIRPYLGNVVVEAGAGIGTYSYQCYRDNKEIYAVDLSSDYIKYLKQKYGACKKFHIIQDNITAPSFVKALKLKQIDSIISFNVLEHLDDDRAALNNFYKILRPGGTVVILVPAHKILFNSLDEGVGHRRRYGKIELKNKIEQSGFKITRLYYFNFLAIIGWYFSGNILHKEKIDSKSTELFNQIAPLAKFIEKFIFNQTLGISLIAIAKKPLR